MHGCDKCMKLGAWVILLLGVAFLLVDLGKWDFWGLSWWTVVFLFLGLKKLSYSYCSECKTVAKKKK